MHHLHKFYSASGPIAELAFRLVSWFEVDNKCDRIQFLSFQGGTDGRVGAFD